MRKRVDFTEIDRIFDDVVENSDDIGGGIFFSTVNICMAIVILVSGWLWMKLDQAERKGGF